MRLLVRRLALLTLLLTGAANALAATPTEFYSSLLDRGVSSFHAERYQEATTYLKLAAFGFVDSVDRYQTAQVYLTLAYDRLGEVEKARDAARRVVAADRIQPGFTSLKLPADIGSSFDTLVTRLLGSADAAFLRRAPSQAPTQNTPQPTPPQATASQPTASQPQPAQQKPPQAPAPAPVKTAPVKPAPAPAPRQAVVAKPAPSEPAPRPALTPQEASSLLGAGERAIAAAQLSEARRTYRQLLDSPGVARELLIRVAEGLYRARDFEGSLLAFSKVGALRRGEEPYHYYMAVASYETGKFAKAKAALDAAIPFIEITADVARYKAKIEASVD